MQAGAYGEHEFDAIRYGEGDDRATVRPADRAIRVSLPAGNRLSMDAELSRFANDPTYDYPWWSRRRD